MAATLPSYANVFIPDHAASGKLVADYGRNPSAFPLNQYCQLVPVEKVAGYYLEMTVEEAGRILNAAVDNFVWYDGQPRPEGNDGTEAHNWMPFRTRRQAYPFTIGQLTADQASWDIVAQHAAIKTRQAMTARTQLAITALTTAGNYPTGHVLDVTTDITGGTGTWAESTTARSDIKRAIAQGIEKILDATLNGVSPDDLVLVVSSAAAKEIAISQEIVDYIKASPEALAQIRGELPGGYVHYGLPNRLHGVKLVIEDTRKVTSKKGATRAVSPVLAATSAILLSRPGGLVGTGVGPNFSSIVWFSKEELNVEKLDDRNNRRILGSVVDDGCATMVGKAASVLFTNIT